MKGNAAQFRGNRLRVDWSGNYLIENNIVELVNQSSEYLLSKLSDLLSDHDDIIEVAMKNMDTEDEYSSLYFSQDQDLIHKQLS